MRLFKRPRARSAASTPDSGAELRRAVSRVVVATDEDPRSVARADPRAQLLRVVAEAVVLQDRAQEVIEDIRVQAPLGDVAPRGGPLARRFFELRRELPPAAGPEMARQCETVSAVLDHHGMLLTEAMTLLSVAWRSPVLAEQLERLDGLGTPAERLDAVYAELAH